jgi:hypothetical protein
MGMGRGDQILRSALSDDISSTFSFDESIGLGTAEWTPCVRPQVRRTKGNRGDNRLAIDLTRGNV